MTIFTFCLYREAIVSSLTREIQAVPVTHEQQQNQMAVSSVISEENLNTSAGTVDSLSSTTEQSEVL